MHLLWLQNKNAHQSWFGVVPPANAGVQRQVQCQVTNTVVGERGRTG